MSSIEKKKMFNEKYFIIGIFVTLCFSCLYFFLGAVYHYTTSYNDVQGLFDFSAWNSSSKEELIIFSLGIIFIGTGISTVMGFDAKDK